MVYKSYSPKSHGLNTSSAAWILQFVVVAAPRSTKGLMCWGFGVRYTGFVATGIGQSLWSIIFTYIYQLIFWTILVRTGYCTKPLRRSVAWWSSPRGWGFLNYKDRRDFEQLFQEVPWILPGRLLWGCTWRTLFRAQRNLCFCRAFEVWPINQCSMVCQRLPKQPVVAICWMAGSHRPKEPQGFGMLWVSFSSWKWRSWKMFRAKPFQLPAHRVSSFSSKISHSTAQGIEP